MNDTTHDGADEGFHEIHLSGKQLVFLFMFTTAVSVLIFLCGVLVGRGVRLERGEAADPATVAASTPAAAPTDTAAAVGPPAAEPPPPAEGELSYKKRLESEKPPTEQLKAHTAEPPQSAASAPAVQAAAPPKPEPQPQPTSGARPGTWVVQVIATREKPTASTLVTRLTQKGYPAFLVSPAAGAPPMFKVQVGRFSERREAEEVARRLEKEEQFKPWISR